MEVHDQGGPWTGPRPRTGRTAGAIIVDQLARVWGRTGDEAADWITWFEMDRP